MTRACLDLVMPAACAACGRAGYDGLCEVCHRQLGVRAAGGCRRCGEPALAPGQLCSSDHRDLRNLAFVVAPFRFAGTGGALVRRFKLDADAAAGRLLARAMVSACADLTGAWRRALVVAVPLHWRKRRARGFDQAEWLARRIAGRLGLEPLARAMERVRQTRGQGDPLTTSREQNVAGAFVTRATRVAGRRVLLVDDVFTSGATLRQCATALRAASALEVGAVVACRS